MAIISTYAPHGGRSYDERLSFFQNPREFWSSISSYGPKLCVGDLNSRLYCRMAGEEDIIGSYFPHKSDKILFPELNRFLLMEFCTSVELCIASTFVQKSFDQLVTY